MAIKLISVDMDGTFLNTDHDYDRERFDNIFHALKEKGVRLVANSGNQYQQIASYFKDYLEDVTIVSEVGAQIFEKGARISYQSFDSSIVATVLKEIAAKGFLSRCSISGLDCIYFEKTADPDFKEVIVKHNPSFKEVDSLLDLPEDYFTLVTMGLPGRDISGIVQDFNELGQGQIKAVSSGFAFIDLVMPDVNKGTALAYLGKKWGIAPNEMMAFGDSDNDLGMLEYVEHSYAMKGSPSSVVAVAKYEAPSNNDSGVFDVIEQVVL